MEKVTESFIDFVASPQAWETEFGGLLLKLNMCKQIFQASLNSSEVMDVGETGTRCLANSQ